MLRLKLGAIFVAAALLGLASPTLAEDSEASTFRVATAGRIAPEITGINNWLNSGPLKLASLRGKVVMVNFWTYGCYNCVNTLPHVTSLYDKYKSRGLVIIGVHTPEFAFEKSTGNVATAIKRHGIHYPVAQDNDFATWKAYGNRYWPAQYIVDKRGRIVFEHAGEGQYDQMERVIQTLLNENG